MGAHQWTRIEGMVIGHRLDPEGVAAELRDRGVLAHMEWFESSPHLLGLTLAVSTDPDAGGAVALVPKGAAQPQPGPSTADLAEELATLFEAEVRLGLSAADHLPEGESPLAESYPGEEDEDATGASRLVEIGRTPASSVPLLAALEGVNLADRELPEGHRALIAQLPPDKLGWNFGELPLVTLSVTDGDFQAFLVTDDHIEHVVTHNWGMENLLVTGAVPATTLPQEVLDLVGDGPELALIAQAVPGADREAFVATTGLKGDAAVVEAVAALGLPVEVASFLLGRTDLEEVEGFEIHRARGISNAIGRSVDIMLTDREKVVHPVFDAYQALSIDRPWIVRSAAAVEAAIGAGLMVLSIRAPRPRKWWAVAGGVVGGLMVVDSVAEIFLAKYVQRKDRERMESESDL
ncbi:hypothetical protein I6B53_09480 [Schaalia sp. 19OD2882]|nr:hypothetical protein I6B53_09480 [Schaalia sp. 19OD2882]